MNSVLSPDPQPLPPPRPTDPPSPAVYSVMDETPVGSKQSSPSQSKLGKSNSKPNSKPLLGKPPVTSRRPQSATPRMIQNPAKSFGANLKKKSVSAKTSPDRKKSLQTGKPLVQRAEARSSPPQAIQTPTLSPSIQQKMNDSTKRAAQLLDKASKSATSTRPSSRLQTDYLFGRFTPPTPLVPQQETPVVIHTQEADISSASLLSNAAADSSVVGLSNSNPSVAVAPIETESSFKEADAKALLKDFETKLENVHEFFVNKENQPLKEQSALAQKLTHDFQKFQETMEDQLTSLETLQQRMNQLNQQFLERQCRLMTEQTGAVQQQAMAQMKQLQEVQMKQAEWQALELQKLQLSLQKQQELSFSPFSYSLAKEVDPGPTSKPLGVKLPSAANHSKPASVIGTKRKVLSESVSPNRQQHSYQENPANARVSPSKYKNPVISQMETRLVALQSNFEKFLKNLAEVNSKVETFERQKREKHTVAVNTDEQPAVREAIHATANIEPAVPVVKVDPVETIVEEVKAKIQTSPLDSILTEIMRSRDKLPFLTTEPVSILPELQPFDYNGAYKLIKELKSTRLSIMAQRPTFPVKHSTDDPHEKTILSEGSSLHDLEERMRDENITDRFNQYMNSIVSGKIVPGVSKPKLPSPTKTLPRQQKIPISSTRVSTDRPHEEKPNTVAKTKTIHKKPPPIPKQLTTTEHRESRSPRKASPTRTETSRASSPGKFTMPNFYNVKVSDKPVFLRRTTIRPPSMNFTSKPLEPEPLPRSPVSPTSYVRIIKEEKNRVQCETIATMTSPPPQTPSPRSPPQQTQANTKSKPIRVVDGSNQTSPPVDVVKVQPVVIEPPRPQVIQYIAAPQPAKAQVFDISVGTDPLIWPPQENDPPPVIFVEQKSFKEDAIQTDIIEEKSEDDLDERLAEWMQGEILARLLAKRMPSKEASSSMSDLLALISSKDKAVINATDGIITEFVDQECLVVALKELKYRVLSAASQSIYEDFLHTVVQEEVEYLAGNALRLHLMNQASLWARNHVLDEFILQEARRMAHDCLEELQDNTSLPSANETVSSITTVPSVSSSSPEVRQKTPTPPPETIQSSEHVTPPPVIEEKPQSPPVIEENPPSPPIVVTKTVAVAEVQTDAIELSEPSEITQSVHVSSTTSITTLSTSISDGEVYTDFCSDGEVVPQFDKNIIQKLIDKYLTGRTSSHVSSSVSLATIDDHDKEESIASLKSKDSSISDGQLTASSQPSGHSKIPDVSSIDYTADEKNILKPGLQGEESELSPGEVSAPSQESDSTFKTPFKPQLFDSSLSPVDPSLPSPISPDMGQGFDKTITVEEKPMEARQILHLLSEMAKPFDTNKFVQPHRPASRLTDISGTTSIPDIESEGEVDIDDATLDAIEF